MHALFYLSAFFSLAASTAHTGLPDKIPMMLFHDNNCTNFMENRTIDMATCTSPATGFSSMLLPESSSGTIRVYSGNTCAGTLGTEYSVPDWHGRCAGFDTCNSASLEA